MLGNHYQIFGSFLIVAMSMVHPFVASLILSAKGCWDNMIDFKDVLISEVEATSRTLPFLKREKLCLLVFLERVVL
jgi:hypothetical protein